MKMLLTIATRDLDENPTGITSQVLEVESYQNADLIAHHWNQLPGYLAEFVILPEVVKEG